MLVHGDEYTESGRRRSNDAYVYDCWYRVISCKNQRYDDISYDRLREIFRGACENVSANLTA